MSQEKSDQLKNTLVEHVLTVQPVRHNDASEAISDNGAAFFGLVMTFLIISIGAIVLKIMSEAIGSIELLSNKVSILQTSHRQMSIQIENSVERRMRLIEEKIERSGIGDE